MNADQLIAQLTLTEEYLNRSTSALTEAHAQFSPADGVYTTAAQLAHIASTIDWFLDGAFSPQGFNMEFEAHDAAAKAVKTLAEARAWVAKSFENARTTLASKSQDELTAPIVEGPVMGGLPRLTIVSGIQEHTAHHRGALSVYTRLQGAVPPMPYM